MKNDYFQNKVIDEMSVLHFVNLFKVRLDRAGFPHLLQRLGCRDMLLRLRKGRRCAVTQHAPGKGGPSRTSDRCLTVRGLWAGPWELSPAFGCTSAVCRRPEPRESRSAHASFCFRRLVLASCIMEDFSLNF